MQDPKEIYPTLLEAHEGLTEAQSQNLNARLILVLCQRLCSTGELRTVLADLRGRLAN